LEKEAKKRLLPGQAAVATTGPQSKSFLLLFFKKEALASFLLLKGPS
jgi:hypothetical protein